ncbi:uncharacterized protein N7483_003530 [Penicillium malachiteum]|uniref:uncharacterized protein n=1 Tax=Penicillium malachiteum TaxID=1324776 RepID=UPI0025490EE2|nr:uncharacterized protein N7483_003530 [Penicillium malachiteum]KAJ5729022.1 hypothetical protein N7483_003530 [Penicillium malachiteum]
MFLSGKPSVGGHVDRQPRQEIELTGAAWTGQRPYQRVADGDGRKSGTIAKVRQTASARMLSEKKPAPPDYSYGTQKRGNTEEEKGVSIVSPACVKGEKSV